MIRARVQSLQGSVLLVVLCFVTVLGISLASYVAVCSRTMQLSNRTAQTALSRQLAEAGLEEALRSFNQNDWSGWSNGPAAVWTVSGTTATCNLSFPAGTFGQGITGTVKIRVDNYNAAQLTSVWSSSTSYYLNDVVSYTDGLWYTCLQNASGASQAPGNLAYWAPAPMSWKWASDITYSPYNTVNYNGVWYRCIKSTSGVSTAVPALPVNWNSGDTYTTDSLVYYSNKAYRCIASASFVSTTDPQTDTTNWSTTLYWIPIISSRPWSSSVTYYGPSVADDVVSYGGLQYRCLSSSVTSNTPPPSDSTNWSAVITPVSLSWTSGTTYSRGSLVQSGGTWYYCLYTNSFATSNTTYWAAMPTPSATTWSGFQIYHVGDYAYDSTTAAWYRCITYHSTSHAPPNATYWAASSAPYLSLGWLPSNPYNFNDVVYINGTWWRWKVLPANSGTSFSSTNWENALSTSWAWVANTSYNLNDVVNYSGSFYRCILAHTSATSNRPPNTSAPYYWSTDPRLSTSWDSGRYYNLNSTVTYNGVWYRCTTANSGSNPSSSSNWSSTTNSPWSANGSYNTSSYVSYGGVWYKCILAPTANQSPNDSTYWTALSAPVIYAEGTIILAGYPSTKTQLRATIAPAPLFSNAVGTTSTLTLGGAGTVDSYDSITDPSASTRGYSAVLASSYSAGTAINGGTGTVQGYLAAPSSTTTPYAPLSSFNGTLEGVSSGFGVDLTRMSRSPYIPQFDAQAVQDHTAISTSGFVNLTLGTPGAPTPSYYYVSGAMNLNLTNENVTIIGPVILDLSTHLRVQALAADKMTIASTGSAEIHFAGYLDVKTTGGGIINSTHDPKKLILIGTGSSMASTPNYSYTTSPFYGTIYMPNTTTALSIGSGDFYGAISAKSVSFSGAANFHYDTSLRYATFSGVDQPYAISQWRELTDASELATMP